MTSEELQGISNETLRIDQYPFTIRVLSPDNGGGFLIEYPDVPECIADGETAEEAIRNGKDALRSLLLTKMEFGDPMPLPESGRVRSVYLEAGVLDSLAAAANRKGIQLSDLVNDVLRRELEIAEALR